MDLDRWTASLRQGSSLSQLAGWTLWVFWLMMISVAPQDWYHLVIPHLVSLRIEMVVWSQIESLNASWAQLMSSEAMRGTCSFLQRLLLVSVWLLSSMKLPFRSACSFAWLLWWLANHHPASRLRLTEVQWTRLPSLLPLKIWTLL